MQVAAELAKHAAEPILYLGHPVQLRKPEGAVAAGTWLWRFEAGALNCHTLLRRDNNARWGGCGGRGTARGRGGGEVTEGPHGEDVYDD